MDSLNFAVIGHPIGHTMSPFIHKKLFEAAGATGEYSALDIPPEKLSAEFENLKKLGGCNVTIPHKSAIIPLLDETDPFAALCGAVNTVKFSGGRAIGCNTDKIGFLKALEHGGLGANGKILLCGCGGAARMIAFVCAERGCNITIAVREKSLKKAEALANEVKRAFPQTEIYAADVQKISGNFDLLCNATPAGMFPNIDSCPAPDSLIASCRGVFDCVYNPAETLLLKKADEFGCKTEGGMSMLVWQAAAAQEFWHGFKFSDEDINSLCETATAEMERIFR